METGRSVYEQPGTRVDGSYRSKEGSKQVKGNGKGSKGKSARGSKSKGIAPYIYCNLYMYIVIAHNCLHDCRFICVYIIIA
jgi:hypothetical protein